MRDLGGRVFVNRGSGGVEDRAGVLPERVREASRGSGAPKAATRTPTTRRRAAPVLKVEPNLFGGYDLRQSDGELVRCEKKVSGETECRVVQEGRRK